MKLVQNLGQASLRLSNVVAIDKEYHLSTMNFIRLTVMMMSLVVVASAQNPGNGGACTFYRNTVGMREEKPTIFGKEFLVPELHMRFVDAKTGKPLIPRVVTVFYLWRWLEYPYPEHGWGAWGEAGELFRCSTGGATQLVVPARTIKPRGWYDGKYTKFPYTLLGSKKPKFDSLEIMIQFGDCAPRIIVKARDLDRYKGSTATLKLYCQWPPVEVEFEKRSN